MAPTSGFPGTAHEWGTAYKPGYWWSMPLIPGFRRQRQADLYAFKASVVYRTNSRMAKAIQ